MYDRFLTYRRNWSRRLMGLIALAGQIKADSPAAMATLKKLYLETAASLPSWRPQPCHFRAFRWSPTACLLSGQNCRGLSRPFLLHGQDFLGQGFVILGPIASATIENHRFAHVGAFGNSGIGPYGCFKYQVTVTLVSF